MRAGGASLAVLALTALGCAHIISTHRSGLPVPTRDWLTVLSDAQTNVAHGRYAVADRALNSFAQRYAGRPEAREAEYWRALFTLDPKNPDSDPAMAAQELDRYLADSSDAPHRVEARSLRRVAIAVDSLDQESAQADARAADSSAAALTADAARQRAADLQREIQRLRNALDRANSELDRIKKRLATPATRPAATPP